jgi:hypothetical protein
VQSEKAVLEARAKTAPGFFAGRIRGLGGSKRRKFLGLSSLSEGVHTSAVPAAIPCYFPVPLVISGKGFAFFPDFSMLSRFANGDCPVFGLIIQVKTSGRLDCTPLG